MKFFGFNLLINLFLLFNGVLLQCITTDESPQVQNLVKSFLDFLRKGGQTQQTIHYNVNSTVNYHIYVAGSSERPYSTFVQNPVPYPLRDDFKSTTDSPIYRLAPISVPNEAKKQNVATSSTKTTTTTTEAPKTLKFTTTKRTTPSTITTTMKTVTSEPVSSAADDEIERISMAKCKEYYAKGYATLDGKKTYMKVYDDNDDEISDARFISDKFLILPASDVVGKNPTYIVSPKNPNEKIPLKKVHIHPEYTNGLLYKNFALVELKNDFDFVKNNKNKLFCLYGEKNFDEEYLVSEGDPYKSLSSSECNARLVSSGLKNNFPVGVSKHQLCLNQCPNKRLAYRDKTSDQIYLLGFISSCSEEPVSIGVYNRIEPAISWIENIVWPKQDIDLERVIDQLQSAVNETEEFDYDDLFPISVPPSTITERISQKKCQEYREKDIATIDGKNTYMQIFQDDNIIGDGRFISERFLIAQAQEIYGKNPTHIMHPRKKDTIKIYKVHIHPDYKDGELYNDFALIELGPDFEIGKSKLFCLYLHDHFDQANLVSEGDPYSLLDPETCDKNLKAADFNQNLLPKGFTNGELCMNQCPNRRLAYKDSNDEIFLLGFISYCIEEPISTAIYSRILPTIDWIEKIVWS